MGDELRLLALIIVANGIPVVAYDLFKGFLAVPADLNRTFVDGRPLLGPSKTWRGLVLSLLGTSLCAPLLGLPVFTGALVAVGAMAGDLLSSFTKRRLEMESGSQAIGLDQVPEALLPLLLVRARHGLGAMEILGMVLAFMVFELVVSRFLFKVHLRKHPY